MLTLLSQREQPDSVKKIAASIGATWHHFILDGGHIETLKGVELSRLFLLHDEIARVQENAVIYLHCSAGLHRTGFIIYALLRYRGVPAAEALKEIERLRPVTAEQVGEDRIALAEDMFRSWQVAPS